MSRRSTPALDPEVFEDEVAPARARRHWEPASADPLGPSKPEMKVERVQRRCLRCNVSFTAQGRFQRLCDVCRKHANSTYTE